MPCCTSASIRRHPFVFNGNIQQIFNVTQAADAFRAAVAIQQGTFWHGESVGIKKCFRKKQFCVRSVALDPLSAWLQTWMLPKEKLSWTHLWRDLSNIPRKRKRNDNLQRISVCMFLTLPARGNKVVKTNPWYSVVLLVSLYDRNWYLSSFNKNILTHAGNCLWI